MTPQQQWREAGWRLLSACFRQQDRLVIKRAAAQYLETVRWIELI